MSDLTHTIVLVEEDETTRTFLADNLSADGFAAHPTDDVDDALALCARAVPDAAIVDVNGGSGRAFARGAPWRARRHRRGHVGEGVRGLPDRTPPSPSRSSACTLSSPEARLSSVQRRTGTSAAPTTCLGRSAARSRTPAISRRSPARELRAFRGERAVVDLRRLKRCGCLTGCSSPRDVLGRLRAEERLLGCCELEAFGSFLIVDRPADAGGWVTIVGGEDARWSTLAGDVFYSRGRAVRVVRGCAPPT
jgi:hypothetical protein